MTAKRIRRLLLPMAGPLPARTVRRYVAGLRTATTRKEAFVHRSVLPHNQLGFAYQVAFVRVLGRFPRQAPLEIDGEIAVRLLVTAGPAGRGHVRGRASLRPCPRRMGGDDSATLKRGGRYSTGPPTPYGTRRASRRGLR